MYMHNKLLQYTVRVAEPNPVLASLLLEQFGGPDGELSAAMRYFTQALGEDDAGRKDMLHDIATEELSHLEVIGSIVSMLNKGPSVRDGNDRHATRHGCSGSGGRPVDPRHLPKLQSDDRYSTPNMARSTLSRIASGHFPNRSTTNIFATSNGRISPAAGRGAACADPTVTRMS